MLHTPECEPARTSWTAASLDDVVRALELLSVGERPLVIAIDGRSASGKSTFGARLAGHLPGSLLLHTDDVAWWESFFGWDHLMADDILVPARRGQAVSFRPPAWHTHAREGTSDVPAGTRVIVVEGVGASRRSLAPVIDTSVWVQSDYAEAHRRGIARDVVAGRTHSEAEDFWAEWTAQEDPFLADDRPWERAAMTVCGTPGLADVDYDAATEVLVAD